mgnify:FL=1
MKEFYIGAKIGFILSLAYVVGLAAMDCSEKTALEIQLLRYELKAYESINEELKSE